MKNFHSQRARLGATQVGSKRASVQNEVHQFMLVQGLSKELAQSIKQEIAKYRDATLKSTDLDATAKSFHQLSTSAYGVPFVNQFNHKKQATAEQHRPGTQGRLLKPTEFPMAAEEDIMDLRTMNKDFGGSLGASFSKGPGYKFPTRTTPHTAPIGGGVGGVVGGEVSAKLREANISTLAKLLPGLTAAEAEVLLAKYGGSGSIGVSAKL